MTCLCYSVSTEKQIFHPSCLLILPLTIRFRISQHGGQSYKGGSNMWRVRQCFSCFIAAPKIAVLFSRFWMTKIPFVRCRALSSLRHAVSKPFKGKRSSRKPRDCTTKHIMKMKGQRPLQPHRMLLCYMCYCSCGSGSRTIHIRKSNWTGRSSHSTLVLCFSCSSKSD